jgi:anti-sigma B factor antagonist
MHTEPEPFSITRSTRAACQVVALAGELDMANAPAVSETLDALADAEQPVIVDLSGLSFIDSSGIHAIVNPRPQLESFALVCPPGNIQRVLSVTRLDRVLSLYETLDEALAALA